MTYIGFIKEFDKNIRAALTFQEMAKLSGNAIPDETRKKILHYLRNGFFLAGAMSFIYDFDNEKIGNLDYYTDGTYVWPSYYAFYLNKYPHLYINPEFISHTENTEFTIPAITDARLAEMDRSFSREWSGNY